MDNPRSNFYGLRLLCDFMRLEIYSIFLLTQGRDINRAFDFIIFNSRKILSLVLSLVLYPI